MNLTIEEVAFSMKARNWALVTGVSKNGKRYYWEQYVDFDFDLGRLDLVSGDVIKKPKNATRIND